MGGRPGLGMAGTGNDVNASNAISACIAGAADKAGVDGGVNDAPSDRGRRRAFVGIGPGGRQNVVDAASNGTGGLLRR